MKYLPQLHMYFLPLGALGKLGGVKKKRKEEKPDQLLTENLDSRFKPQKGRECVLNFLVSFALAHP